MSPDASALLSRKHITLISAHADVRVEQAIPIHDRTDVEALVCELLAAGEVRGTRTLDLVGATSDAGLLQLGSWTVDAAHPTTAAFFRELADHDVLVRLGIIAVRLIGSNTATAGRATLEALARILDAEVHGTVGLVHAAQFDAHGFTGEELLVGTADLRRGAPAPFTPPGVPTSRLFDLDALPRNAEGTEVTRVRDVLELVVRDAGVQMAGLLAVPSHAITLLGRRVQVLLGASWVRTDDGVLYPVRDPAALRALLAA